MWKTSVVVAVVLGIMSCGDKEEATCTDMVESVYSVENCAIYDISWDPPEKMSASEAMLWCREVVVEVGEYCPHCQDKLDEWLRCTPTECGDCNDEIDRLINCCSF